MRSKIETHKAENAKIGETIFVKIRNNNIPAQIVKLPFYKG